MADESHYSSTSPSAAPHKRKYDDSTPTPQASTLRRPSGFSSPNSALPPPPPLPQTYNSVPPPVDGFQAAKQKAQEIAARLLAAAASSDSKRPRVDNNNTSSFSPPPEAKPYAPSPSDGKPSYASPSPIPVSYGSYMGSSSKKIEVPNGRVGVIIGKGGETIKYLQIQSGAKIQVTRDMDADPHNPMRPVELVGTPDQVEKAEQLIRDVLAEADTGGSGTVARRFPGGPGGGQGSDGSDHIILKVPNNKVGLVIGKGGETIKSMQARTGARIQVIPLHPPPGDTSQDRSVHIEGTSEQIEAAKQLIDEVCSSENRTRNQSMGGGYSQQGYQARPPTNWAPAGTPPVQQSGYGYMQPGAYPGQTQQYNMPQSSYGGYPQQTPGGYPSNWDQSGQQTSQTYDYYNQAPAQQQLAPGGPAAPTDNSGYNYSQPPASGYNQQGQAYSQDGYGGYSQSGYGQPQYDQQSYGSAHGYGSAANPTPEGHNTSYGTQGDSTQAPPQAPAQGYSSGQQPSPNTTGYPPQATTQAGYGVPPSSQAGYGSQTAAPTGYGSSYGPPQGQKQQANPPAYGQAQQSPGAAYGQHPPAQPGYPPSQPPPDSGSQRVPPSYGAAGVQAAYGYGAPPAAQPGYGQGPPPPPYGSYATSYAQPAAYNTDGSATNNGAAQPAQQTGAAKASPPSLW